MILNSQDVCNLINAIWFNELSADWLLLEIVASVFGGSATAWMAIYSYLSDVTTEQNRTVRIALNDGILWVAMAISSGTSVLIFRATSYVFVIGLATLSHVIVFAYVLLILPESRPRKAVGEGMA